MRKQKPKCDYYNSDTFCKNNALFAVKSGDQFIGKVCETHKKVLEKQEDIKFVFIKLEGEEMIDEDQATFYVNKYFILSSGSGEEL